MPAISRVHLANFKSIKELDVDLPSLTILIGPNGAGKSSILQALSIMKKFVTTPPSVSLDNLGDFSQSGYLQLGRFDELVFMHDLQSSIEIGITSVASNQSTEYNLTIGKNKCQSALKAIQGEKAMVLDFQIPYGVNKSQPYDLKYNDNTYSVVWNGVSATPQAPTANPPEDFVSLLNLHSRALAGVFLVHIWQSFRSWSYQFNSAVDYNKVSLNDNELANLLSLNTDTEEKVGKWLERIMDTEVAARFIPPSLALRIEARWGKLRTPLASDGLGLNRLAFILANLAIPSTALLMVEEPEANMHPAALAAFAKSIPEILVQEKKQLILSTHSEHMVLPLLLEVAKGKLDPHDLTIYSLEKENLQTKVQRLTIDKNGQIEGGLKGFFDADWKLTEDFLKALEK